MRRAASEENAGDPWLARTYAEAVAPFLGAEELEAAGVFQRPGRLLDWGWLAVVERVLRGFERVEEGLGTGGLGRLPESFLLAVTREKVYAFKFEEAGGTLIKEKIAAFDRDEIRIRSMAGGEVLSLEAMENGRTRSIELDGEVVDLNPGAAEVVAALST